MDRRRGGSVHPVGQERPLLSAQSPQVSGRLGNYRAGLHVPGCSGRRPAGRAVAGVRRHRPPDFRNYCGIGGKSSFSTDRGRHRDTPFRPHLPRRGNRPDLPFARGRSPRGLRPGLRRPARLRGVGRFERGYFLRAGPFQAGARRSGAFTASRCRFGRDCVAGTR